MLDGDDFSDIAEEALDAASGNWIVLLLVVGVVVLVAILSSGDECGKRHCETGYPKLVDHECLCVLPPTPRKW